MLETWPEKWGLEVGAGGVSDKLEIRICTDPSLGTSCTEGAAPSGSRAQAFMDRDSMEWWGQQLVPSSPWVARSHGVTREPLMFQLWGADTVFVEQQHLPSPRGSSSGSRRLLRPGFIGASRCQRKQLSPPSLVRAELICRR